MFRINEEQEEDQEQQIEQGEQEEDQEEELAVVRRVPSSSLHGLTSPAAASPQKKKRSESEERQTKKTTTSSHPHTGGKGKDPKAAKRHAKKHSHTIIKDPSIKRLSKRGGVLRMNKDVYPLSRDNFRAFLEDVIKYASILCEGNRKKVISSKNIIYALKNKGITLYD
jgi:histone H4